MLLSARLSIEWRSKKERTLDDLRPDEVDDEATVCVLDLLRITRSQNPAMPQSRVYGGHSKRSKSQQHRQMKREAKSDEAWSVEG